MTNGVTSVRTVWVFLCFFSTVPLISSFSRTMRHFFFIFLIKQQHSIIISNSKMFILSPNSLILNNVSLYNVFKMLLHTRTSYFGCILFILNFLSVYLEFIIFFLNLNSWALSTASEMDKCVFQWVRYIDIYIIYFFCQTFSWL